MRILSVRLSVCPSVTCVYSDKTVERSVQIYIPYERTFSLVFWEEEWLVKPVCDLLLVINSNWHPISYRFGVIAAYCSNLAPMQSLWLKISGRWGRPPPIIFAPIVRPMNALQICPWQFFTRVTAEALRAKIDRQPVISHQRGHWSNISGTRGRPHQ